MKTHVHWADKGELTLVWGMRLLLRIYRQFGPTVLNVFLYPVVFYYWLVNKPARDASLAYLARLAVFAPQRNVRATYYWSYRHFIEFAHAIVDKLAAWTGAVTLGDVLYRGREDLFAVVGRGRGAVLLGSHLGNLDVCRVIAGLEERVKITVLVHTKHAEKFNRLAGRYHGKGQTDLIQVTDITAASASELSDKIDNGELVIIAADRVPVINRGRVVLADFLGAKAPFPQGPFILAALMKCPVYTVFCLKRRGKFVIYFDKFSDRLRLARKGREQALSEAVQRFADRLQHYCLKAPLQWFNFYDFWKLAK